jgi:hypothetical protein
MAAAIKVRASKTPRMGRINITEKRDPGLAGGGSLPT